MNYAELCTNIQDICENTFTTQQLAMFTTQAEQRIYNMVQFPSLRKNMTGNIQSGNKYLKAPDDFLAVYSLAVIDGQGNYEYLLNKDVNFIRAVYPNPTTNVGIPRYYALFGPAIVANSITDELTFIMGPTPNAAYTVELHFYYYPESISVAPDGRTWLGDNFDPVLLYGALVEAATFLKGEADIIALYNAKYNEALALPKRLGDGMERQDSYRSGQYRQQVT